MPATEKKHIECPYCGYKIYRENSFGIEKESPTMFWNYEQPKSSSFSTTGRILCLANLIAEELDRYAVSQGLPIARKMEVTNDLKNNNRVHVLLKMISMI